MKLKLITIFIISTVIILFIYYGTNEHKYNIVALGDGTSLGVNYYGIPNYNFNTYLKDYLQEQKKLKKFNQKYANHKLTILELNQQIKDNKEIEHQKLQNILYKADIITVSVGLEELILKSNTRKLSDYYINKYCNEMNDLFSLIKIYRNKYVFIIGLYETNNLDAYVVSKINSYLKELCFDYNYTFIDISDINKSDKYFVTYNEYYLNYLGHEYIFYKIKNMINT